MDKIYGEKQDRLLKSITFSHIEKKKILEALSLNKSLYNLSRSLRRSIKEIRLCISVTPHLRLRARTEKEDGLAAERARIAWLIEDNRWR